MVKRLSRALCVLVFATAVAPAAQAQLLDSGLYFEIAVGKAKFTDVTTAGLDALTADFFDSYALPVQSLTSSLNNKDRSTALITGYSINPYLAFEAGFFRLGAFQYTSSGTVSDEGTILPASFNFSYRAKGFLVGAAATLPLGRYMELRGRAGVSTTDTRVKFAAVVDGEGIQDRLTDTSQDFYFGGGVGVRVWDYYRVGIDWMRHNKVGRNSGNGSVDVDNIQLAFTYTY